MPINDALNKKDVEPSLELYFRNVGTSVVLDVKVDNKDKKCLLSFELVKVPDYDKGIYDWHLRVNSIQPDGSFAVSDFNLKKDLPSLGYLTINPAAIG